MPKGRDKMILDREQRASDLATKADRDIVRK